MEEAPNPRFLTPFQKLLLLKVLKPDKLSLGIAEYVITRLDARFVEVPPLKLADIFKDTSPTVPVIFILSVGADPTGMLLDYADSQDQEKHVSQVRGSKLTVAGSHSSLHTNRYRVLARLAAAHHLARPGPRSEG